MKGPTKKNGCTHNLEYFLGSLDPKAVLPAIFHSVAEYNFQEGTHLQKPMKKSIFSLGLLAVIVIASAAPADEKAIRANYATLDSALASKNIGKIKAITHKDCVWVQKGVKQEMKAKDVFAQLEGAFKMAKSMKNTTTVKSVKVTGSKAVVQSSSVMTAVMPDPSTKGKTMTIVSKGASTSSWVKSGAKWLVIRVEMGNTTTTVNGKPINMQGGPR